MAQDYEFHIVTAPFFVKNSAGATTNKVMRPGVSPGYPDNIQLNVGNRIPEILDTQDRPVTVDVLRGPNRIIRNRFPRVRVRFIMDFIDGDTWKTLNHIMHTGRLVGINPGFDRDTMWASNFNGVDGEGNINEVGKPGTYTDRISTLNKQAWAGRWSGHDALEINASTGPKFTQGYMGHALFMPSDRQNFLATRVPPTANGATIIKSQTHSNNPVDGGFMAYFNNTGGTTQRIEWAGVTITSNDDVSVSIWHKGTGAFKLGVNGTLGDVQTSSPTEWRRAVADLNPGGSTGRILEIHPEAGGGLIHFSGAQMEQGPNNEDRIRPSAYIDPEALENPTSPDKLKVVDNFPLGAGATFAWWWYKPESVGGSQKGTECYFWHLGGGNGGFCSWRSTAPASGTRGYNLKFTEGMNTLTPTTADDTSLEGSWVFVTAILDHDGAGNVRQRLFENGTLAATMTGTQTITSSFVADPTDLYILSHVSDDQSCDFPVDSFRFDARPWTQADMDLELKMKNDEGVRGFLSYLNGRRFRIASVPRGFRGPFTDQVVGDLILEEASHDGAGVLC